MSNFGSGGYSIITPNPQTATQTPQSPFSAQQALGSLRQGYASALSNLQNAANLSTNTTSGETAQLNQTLGQQQSNISQNLANRGLGNTTVSATAQQAPMQNYNIALANVANQNALRQMGVQSQMAGLNQQGGTAQAALMNPYAQAQYGNQINNANLAGQQNYNAAMQSALANAASQQNAMSAFNASPAGGSQGSQGYQGSQVSTQQNSGQYAGTMGQGYGGLTNNTGVVLDGNGNPIADPSDPTSTAQQQALMQQAILAAQQSQDNG